MKVDPREVEALVARAKAGDAGAFGELVRRYRSRIYALTLHLTGSRAEADDITQDVFLRAFRKLGEFAGRSEFFTWLYRIAVNRALNARRDGARRRTADLDDPRVQEAVAVDAYGDPRRAAELRQIYARLVAALDTLDETLRSTVVLVALQGLSHEEAAVVLACAPGTVGWRIHEARRLLRAAVQKGERAEARGRAASAASAREVKEITAELPLFAFAPVKA